MATTETVESAGRVLDVLDLLMGRSDYAHGVTPGEIAGECRLSPSAVTRYIATLEGRGWIERIPETGRIRAAVRVARASAAMLASLDAAERRAQELRQRILTGGATN